MILFENCFLLHFKYDQGREVVQDGPNNLLRSKFNELRFNIILHE